MNELRALIIFAVLVGFITLCTTIYQVHRLNTIKEMLIGGSNMKSFLCMETTATPKHYIDCMKE